MLLNKLLDIINCRNYVVFSCQLLKELHLFCARAVANASTRAVQLETTKKEHLTCTLFYSNEILITRIFWKRSCYENRTTPLN